MLSLCTPTDVCSTVAKMDMVPVFILWTTIQFRLGETYSHCRIHWLWSNRSGYVDTLNPIWIHALPIHL